MTTTIDHTDIASLPSTAVASLVLLDLLDDAVRCGAAAVTRNHVRAASAALPLRNI